MQYSLKEEIKKRLEARHMSVNALEKEASLKKGTVQNIMRGKSKHPRIDLIQAIAASLDCTVIELLGQEEETIPLETNDTLQNGNTTLKKWHPEVYMHCLQCVSELCQKQGFQPYKEEILPLIDEIYEYSLRSETGRVDVYFVEWLLEKNLFNTR